MSSRQLRPAGHQKAAEVTLWQISNAAELTVRQNSQGPACTMTGVASSVCSSVGCTASFISTARAPLTPRSSAVTGLPAVQVEGLVEW